MEKEEMGLIVLFVVVIVGFAGVYQFYDLNLLDGDNGNIPDNDGSSMDNLPGQFDSLYLSQTTTTENIDFDVKLEIWYRKTDHGLDYRQVQVVDENSQIQIYNSEKENLYRGSGGEGQWIYQELPYENFENSIGQTLEIFDGVATEYTEGDNYPLQGTLWNIRSIEKNSGIEDEMFVPPENVVVVSPNPTLM